MLISVQFFLHFPIYIKPICSPYRQAECCLWPEVMIWALFPALLTPAFHARKLNLKSNHKTEQPYPSPLCPSSKHHFLHEALSDKWFSSSTLCSPPSLAAFCIVIQYSLKLCNSTYNVWLQWSIHFLNFSFYFLWSDISPYFHQYLPGIGRKNADFLEVSHRPKPSIRHMSGYLS